MIKKCFVRIECEEHSPKIFRKLPREYPKNSLVYLQINFGKKNEDMNYDFYQKLLASLQKNFCLKYCIM